MAGNNLSYDDANLPLNMPNMSAIDRTNAIMDLLGFIQKAQRNEFLMPQERILGVNSPERAQLDVLMRIHQAFESSVSIFVEPINERVYADLVVDLEIIAHWFLPNITDPTTSAKKTLIEAINDAQKNLVALIGKKYGKRITDALENIPFDRRHSRPKDRPIPPPETVVEAFDPHES